MIPVHLKSLPALLLIGLLAGMPGGILAPIPAPAQEGGTEEAPPFIPLGVVAFDPDYRLTKDRGFIAFRIRNDGLKTISHLFGWVYRSRQGPDGSTRFTLMNNPHQSATLVQGGPHRAGSVAQWRFILQNTPPPDADETFTRRINPKSVFYKNVEPPQPPPESGNP